MLLRKPLRVAGLLAFVYVCLGLVLEAPVRGDVVITTAAGVKNPPDPQRSNVPETAVADKAQLVTSASFDPLLSALLVDQKFIAANNWIYSFKAADLPKGIVNPVALPTVAPNNANFNITTYDLRLNPGKTAFGETFKFTLLNPPADPVLNGATITKHWIQLVNESKQVTKDNGTPEGTPYGFTIPGQQGFWALDNGFVDWSKAGDAPFYDSNAGPAVFPPNFVDNPEFFSAQTGTTYLHFITIPAWDVAFGGKDYVIVGDTGITWGFTIIPEPSTIILVSIGGVLLVIVAWFQRPRSRQCAA